MDTFLAYFGLSPDGEESLNKLLIPDVDRGGGDPDPDHLRGGPSHAYNTSCVKDPNALPVITLTLLSRPGVRANIMMLY